MIVRSYALSMLVFCAFQIKDGLTSTEHREKRNLLYPFSTLLQLNIGIGTPTPIATVMYNWAIQANFQLPWNISQIPTNVLFANSGYDGESKRFKRDDLSEFSNTTNSDALEKSKDEINYLSSKDLRDGIRIESENDDEVKLHHVYKYVEDMLNVFGHNGSSCVKQTLCRLAADPLYADDDDDLLHEIASFVLTPTEDNETQDRGDNDEALQYIKAYEHGMKSEDCLQKFDGCSLSLLDMFSVLY